MSATDRITIAQAARRFNLSARWIQKLVQRGDIAAIKITSRLFLIDPVDLAAWIVSDERRPVGYPKGKPRTNRLSQSIKGQTLNF